MSYEVTASRMRPQSFSELTGQEFVVSTLNSSIEKNRIAHAYLFSGPRGVGKTSAARILARSLNCVEGPTKDPCGVCANCQEIKKGNSLDVIEIDGASNTGVNDIREIKDEVLFSPTNSKYKIYIIDEVHMLSNSAFNALLKTIEEPPPYIIFIFATTEIHKVPATIKSRCQQFNFRLIALDKIKDLLKDICEEMQYNYEEDALFWIAKESTGSLRDAYTLFDQVISFTQGEIFLDIIREKLGLIGIEKLNTLAEKMVLHEKSDLLYICDDIFTSGVSVEQFLIDLTEYFRNCLLIKSGVDKEGILGYDKNRFSNKVINHYTPFQLERAVGQLLQLYKEIKFSLNQRYELELMLTRLASLDSYFDQRDIIGKIEELKGGLLKGLTMEATPPQAKKIYEVKSDSSPVSVENITEEESGEEKEIQTRPIKPVFNFKEGFLEAAKKKISVSTTLSKALSIDLVDQTLKIVLGNNFEANMIRKEIKFLTDKAKEISGETIEIQIVVEKAESCSHESAVDEAVEMAKNVFRGQVL